jgi:hypothetical protein
MLRKRIQTESDALSGMLPNLSNLPIGENLFDFLISNGVAKEAGCTRHKEPIVSKEYEQNNCAIEGYFMFLPLDPRESQPESAPRDGDLDVNIPLPSGTSTVTMKRTRKFKKDRYAAFEKDEEAWIEKTFEMVCRRPDGNTVYWNDYGEALTRMTEYYYLDPEKKGHLFVSTFMNQTDKQKAHMPFTGVADGPYLFVALVCAIPGFGKGLMHIAKEVAYKLGCTGIALASLSNSAGFYYSLGYRFLSKWDGSLVDATRFTKEEVRGGLTKTILVTDIPDDRSTAGAQYWKLYRDKRKYQREEGCEEGGSMCVISMGP